MTHSKHKLNFPVSDAIASDEYIIQCNEYIIYNIRYKISLPFFCRAREDGYKKEIQLHNRDLRVMPADSWHQPDSIENKIKLAPIHKQKSDSDESGDEQLSQYYASGNEVTIHHLNDDCLMHIFLYLPIIDRIKIERGKNYNSTKGISQKKYSIVEN